MPRQINEAAPHEEMIDPLSQQEEFAGVVARGESLPLALLRDFVRGRNSPFEARESERQASW